MKDIKGSIKTLYEVRPIPFSYSKGWCLERHYARRTPTRPIISFGLFTKPRNMLVGVCVFADIANPFEPKEWNPFPLLELSRLIVEEELPKNTTSFFVGQCLNKIPKPKVIISYADLGMNHYGYIYQATNWIFTGFSKGGMPIYIMKDGRELHHRHYKRYIKHPSDIKAIKKTSPKARYYYFCANKKDKKEMMKILKSRYPILPYPKGESIRYDANYKKSEFQLF